jgi:hypothetical protein
VFLIYLAVIVLLRREIIFQISLAVLHQPETLFAALPKSFEKKRKFA